MSGRYSFVALAVILCMVGVNGQISHGQCNRPSTQAMPGQYVPQCTGLFDIIQTNPSTGYRWCVNPITGVKVEGTDVAPGNSAKPECPKCLYDLANAVINGVMWDIDGMTPECDANGNFKPHQINPNHPKYSWCVNITTGDILTAFDNPGLANCDGRQKRSLTDHLNVHLHPYGPTGHNAPCDVARRHYYHPLSTFNIFSGTIDGILADKYDPQCTHEGYFEVIQNIPPTGYSWCVRPESGKKIEGTQVGLGKTPTCGNCLNDYAKVLVRLANYEKGFNIPTCDDKGNYNALQLHGDYSSGSLSEYSVCVNTETGEEIEGTKYKREC